MTFSRRDFLAQLSSVAAIGSYNHGPGQWGWRLPPGQVLGTSVTVAKLLPPLDEATLRALALAAIDAARAAGATYADVRATAGVRLQVDSSWTSGGESPLVPRMSAPSLGFGIGLGVRALVDGAWGFSGGEATTREAAAATGRAAAALAKGNRLAGEPRVALAPLPSGTNGEWSTPIQKDPFEVPIGEQGQLQLETLTSTMRRLRLANGASIQFKWWHRIQVFASTENSLQVQDCHHARTVATVNARAQGVGGKWNYGFGMAEGLGQGGVGYEGIQQATLGARMSAAVDRAVEGAKRRSSRSIPADVGRYDVVLSADVVAYQLALTLGEALDLERVLGYRANREGTSYLAPPLEMLGQYQVASPLVTVRADRNTPNGTATLKWDDEGMPTTAYPVIERGVITGYHTSRETAPALASWFARHGQPVRSTACVRGVGPLPPIVRQPNLTLQPAPTDVSVDDLIRGVRRGFYVLDSSGAVDQQLLSNQFTVPSWSVYAIRNGRLGPPVTDFTLQYLTPNFWRSLDALGGPSTAQPIEVDTDARLDDDDPRHFPFSTVRAVPALFRQVNVLNSGRTA